METRTEKRTTTTSRTTSSSSSSSIARACVRACEDKLYTTEINVAVADLRDAYLESIGSEMSERCERYLRMQLARGVPYLYYLYALLETGFAPRPSWRYTEAVVGRLMREHTSEQDIRLTIEFRHDIAEMPYSTEQ